MNWNQIPDEVKKIMVEFTGGFRRVHCDSFHTCLKSIQRRCSDLVCYKCGIEHSLLKCGISRCPSTKMYVKRNHMSVEILGKCTKHDQNPSKSGEVAVPRDIETDYDLIMFIDGLFPDTKRIFMFSSDENSNPIWRSIRSLDVTARERRSRSTEDNL